MAEAARVHEIKSEQERHLHLTRIVDYVRRGNELPEPTLTFFDHDAATLLHFLDKLGHKLHSEGQLNTDHIDDLSTCTGRLFELRGLYAPPPPR